MYPIRKRIYFFFFFLIPLISNNKILNLKRISTIFRREEYSMILDKSKERKKKKLFLSPHNFLETRSSL